MVVKRTIEIKNWEEANDDDIIEVLTLTKKDIQYLMAKGDITYGRKGIERTFGDHKIRISIEFWYDWTIPEWRQKLEELNGKKRYQRMRK